MDDDLLDFADLFPEPVEAPKPSAPQPETDDDITGFVSADHFVQKPDLVRLIDEARREEFAGIVMLRYPRSTASVVQILVDNSPEEFIRGIVGVNDLSDRANGILETLLRQGYITGEDVAAQGNPGSRSKAIHDVRERGIPLETYTNYRPTRWVLDPQKFVAILPPRRPLPEAMRQRVFAESGYRCAFCGTPHESLQTDHRIPYEVAGNSEHEKFGARAYLAYQGLCPSCNTGKDVQGCGPCKVKRQGEPDTCRRCRYAYPEDYDHVAGVRRRMLAIDLDDPLDIEAHDALRELAQQEGQTIKQALMGVVRDVVSRRRLPVVAAE